jgi:hypothetical protein
MVLQRHNSITIGKSLPGDAVVKGALCGTPKLSTLHTFIAIGKSLPGDVVVRGDLVVLRDSPTHTNFIAIGKSLPCNVVVKGALCDTPKTLHFTHLHSNGKKYIFCTGVLQAKTNLQLQKQAYGIPKL